MCVCITESPHCAPEILLSLLYFSKIYIYIFLMLWKFPHTHHQALSLTCSESVNQQWTNNTNVQITLISNGKVKKERILTPLSLREESHPLGTSLWTYHLICLNFCIYKKKKHVVSTNTLQDYERIRKM